MDESSSRYTNMKVHVSDNQKDKIKKAVEDNSPVSIRFTYEHLTGNDVLAFTKSQLDKIAEAYTNKKAVTIKLSKTQVQYNKQIEGGFIGPLLAGVASAVLPGVASFLWDKITGKGLFINRGNGIVKVKQFGNGLWLRPYKTDGISGKGLWMKTGNGYEQIKDASVNDASIIEAVLANN